ncbi:type 1 glutamine amidotransferase [Luteipulveratus mongoliensis]|uniref:Aminotransferase n=1 Tax=Luteipulveratus mongoliensis TaxID=571913 RepID=A0A0K1JK41_9MICO|nr:type 1 glutamine amidotransferase [Luteipulveratus mongoliensis]AKU17087.1 aminotransferase [Luteipulveratus mongoliensis]
MPTALRPRILLVQNDAASGPGRLIDWIADAGADSSLVAAHAGEPVPTDTAGYDAVVLLGGGLLPDEDERAPWLADERALTTRAVEDGTPLLGICLGGQLLAHTMGGTVRGNHGEPERGVTAISVRPEAANDVLLQGLPASVPAIESHRDAITSLPPDAVWLASSDRCPYQAFRCGSRAWGVQFHPEVSAERIRTWDPQGLREQGFDPQDVVAQADLHDGELARLWGGFVRRFLDLTRAPATI